MLRYDRTGSPPVKSGEGIKILGLREVEWAFLATFRALAACEHLEPQIFLVA